MGWRFRGSASAAGVVASMLSAPVKAQSNAAQSNAQADTGEPSAQAQDDHGSGVMDIIVTAQKRSESINSVPMSVTAVSGEALTQRGMIDTADLAKVVRFGPKDGHGPFAQRRE